MQIATWNINSVKARIDLALSWLKEAKPDVVCLQEIKCEDAAFPTAMFEEAGYHVLVHGQKAYNGVAILSKSAPEDVRRGLPGNVDDTQARYLEAVMPSGSGVVRVASIYLPNGNPPDSEKYDYKLQWMDRLIAHVRELLRLEEPVVLAGDYNVIPSASDARFPANWEGDALFLPRTRAKFQHLVNLGLTDAVRQVFGPGDGPYTFWDYQAGAWQKDNGIRIDHMMLSPQAADRLSGARIDRHVRGWERPSDHVPVVVSLK
ncbi:MAG: exodeoxyribonuclease III [Alphaproteobacteria bacterium]|nr:exodeoxyribonuclease III [Alphaproteobacteria bacterium]